MGKESNFVQYVENSDNQVCLFQTLDDHAGAVNSVAFYGNNLLASGSGLVAWAKIFYFSSNYAKQT